MSSNVKVKTELLEESKYYENYFIGEKNSWAKKVRSYKGMD